MAIPRIMGDPRYPEQLDKRAKQFSARADEMSEVFADCEHIVFNKPGGAFYYTIMFNDGLLDDTQSLPIENPKVRETIERMTQGVEPDKRFVYYLIGATGIVVVPLTGFQCEHHGFRATLLEADDDKRAWILKSLRDAIDQYVASSG
jgi:aspartate/methionine/tyrosine aminotransferase